MFFTEERATDAQMWCHSDAPSPEDEASPPPRHLVLIPARYSIPEAGLKRRTDQR